MKFDEARFNSFLSELGLPSSYQAKKNLTIYQGKVDTVVFGNDLLKIDSGNIRSVALENGTPKLSFQDLEEVMTISQKIKNAGFPHLEISFSDHLVSAKPVGDVPSGRESSELTGLPASAGKVTARCLVYPTHESPAGKIIVLKNSKDLHRLLKDRPSGIILEEGNLLSHASILAREAGIPALVMVVDATKKLKSGEEIHLDALRGIISIPTPRSKP